MLSQLFSSVQYNLQAIVWVTPSVWDSPLYGLLRVPQYYAVKHVITGYPSHLQDT